MNFKEVILALVLLITLSFAQVMIRSHFDFYDGDIFVSLLIGGYLGLFSGTVVKLLDIK